MNFDEYQKLARQTAIYPSIGMQVYPALGLAGESGEVCEKIKKYIRGDFNYETLRAGLQKELGDVLWYIANLAEDVGLSLETIAQDNIDKLQDRKERDVLQGDGDSR